MVIGNKKSEEVSAFSVYPNPFTNYPKIELNDYAANLDVDMKVYDVFGKAIIHQKLSGVNEVNLVEMKNSMPGIYIIEITYGQKGHRQKVIKL